MTPKPLLLIAALALTLPATANASVESDRAAALARMHARAEGTEVPVVPRGYEMRHTTTTHTDMHVPPGHKVTTVYKGQKVTTSYVKPSAPVAGARGRVVEQVYIPVEGTVDVRTYQPATGGTVIIRDETRYNDRRMTKSYNE